MANKKNNRLDEETKDNLVKVLGTEQADESGNVDLPKPPKAKSKQSKPSDNYLRVDLMPFGYDLKDYVEKKALNLSVERGKKVSATALIQELIIADMEADKNKGKQTKHDKIIAALNNVDDKKLSAIATLLDIQL